MTDQPSEDVLADPSQDSDESWRDRESGTREPVDTGHPAVDDVVRSLDSLDDAPVDAHVAVFEQAHEQLRRTLSGAGDDQG